MTIEKLIQEYDEFSLDLPGPSTYTRPVEQIETASDN